MQRCTVHYFTFTNVHMTSAKVCTTYYRVTRQTDIHTVMLIAILCTLPGRNIALTSSDHLTCLIALKKVKGKGFPYSLPSVGPGADTGVQTVSPQVNISHPPGGRLSLLSDRPAVTFPAAEHHRPVSMTVCLSVCITAPWPVPSYTAW